MKYFSLALSLFLIGVTSWEQSSAKDVKESSSQQIAEFMKDHSDRDFVYTIPQASKGGGSSVFLNNDVATKIRIKSFNTSIQSNGVSGQIIACRRTLDIPVGRANANTSYGGACLYQDNTNYTPVYICNDVMVGHFKMVPIKAPLNQFDGSIGEVADFTLANCYGG